MKRKDAGRTGFIGYGLIIVFSLLYIWLGNKIATGDQRFFAQDDGSVILAVRVDKILDRQETREDMGNTERVTVTIGFEATVIKGERKGEVLSARQINDSLMAVGYKEAEAGDKLLLYGYEEEGGTDWVMHEYLRSDTLILLVGVFFAMVILYGRKKGFDSVLSLVFTCLGIFLVFIPSILAGKNVYAACFLQILFSVVMTLSLVNGLNRKSLAAGIGLTGGLAAAGVLFWLMDLFLKLTGYINEETVYLAYINPADPIDLKSILFAGILLSSLGAAMDVAVSIAAALKEIYDSLERPNFAALMKSGINIGQDILGTMINTLVLAYLGSSLSLVLILVVYSNSLLELFNKEMIIVEIMQSLTGSIGLLAAIPLTTLAASYIFTAGKRKQGREVYTDR